MTTSYILIAIQFEEADLVAVHGDKYLQYRKHVPMIVPTVKRPGPDTRQSPARQDGRLAN